MYVTNTTNVVLDINGYFAPVSGSTLAFYPLTPCRVADTRNAAFPKAWERPSCPANRSAISRCWMPATCNIPSQRRGLFAELHGRAPRGRWVI